MIDRIEWDYKFKLKGYLKQNHGVSEQDFLLKEIETFENKINELKNISDKMVIDEIKQEYQELFKKNKNATEIEHFIKRTLNGRKKGVKNEIKDLRNILLEYQIKFERFKINRENDSCLDYSDTKRTERIIMLEKLGVLKFLKEKEPFNLSINALASAISGFTGINASTVQSYINPIDNPGAIQKNNPLTKEKNVSKVIEKLSSIGYKLSE